MLLEVQLCALAVDQNFVAFVCVVGDVGLCVVIVLVFFFFNDTATTEIYTLSLHDALPIWAP